MSKHRGMILGSFIGDSLALGAHWIYNQEEIRSKFGNITDLHAPETEYHRTKYKGDFTHYGDLALMVFEYLKNNSYNRNSFYKQFKQFMKSYQGYMDHATKETVANLDKELLNGSESSELGGITKIISVCFLNKEAKKGLYEALEIIQTTHNNPVLYDRSEFLIKLIYRVLKGERPSDGIQNLRKETTKTIFEDIEYAKRLLETPTSLALKQIGQSCDSDYAFPAVIYLLLKYEDNFETALIENVYAGGDSAARGMIVGAILGAYHGEKKLPINWLAGMNKLQEIEKLMA